MGRASNRVHAKSGHRSALFAEVMGGDGRGRKQDTSTEPGPDAVTDPDLLQAVWSRLPAQPQEFAEVADRFSGVAFAYNPENMRIICKSVNVIEYDEDPDYSEEIVGYVVAGKADGLGANAGNNSFIAFIVAWGEVDKDVFLAAESTNLDEAVAALNNSLASYLKPGSEPAVSAETVRRELLELLGL